MYYRVGSLSPRPIASCQSMGRGDEKSQSVSDKCFGIVLFIPRLIWRVLEVVIFRCAFNFLRPYPQICQLGMTELPPCCQAGLNEVNPWRETNHAAVLRKGMSRWELLAFHFQGEIIIGCLIKAPNRSCSQ